MYVTIWPALMWILVWSGITQCYVESRYGPIPVSALSGFTGLLGIGICQRRGFGPHSVQKAPKIVENGAMDLGFKFCLMVCEEMVWSPCQGLTPMSQVDPHLVIDCLSVLGLALAIWSWSSQSFLHAGAVRTVRSWVIQSTVAVVKWQVKSVSEEEAWL